MAVTSMAPTSDRATPFTCSFTSLIVTPTADATPLTMSAERTRNVVWARLGVVRFPLLSTGVDPRPAL